MKIRTSTLLFLILACALGLYLAFAQILEGKPIVIESISSTSSPSIASQSSKSLPTVTIGTARIEVDVATTTAAVRRGLSGRLRLEEDRGMLFIFPVADIYRFWMPDMHFPLDIIWIHDGEVVDISRNVSNDFDPENLRFYSPHTKSERVLEVNAGFAEKHGIEIGNPVVFRNIF